jgi:hypothetical protein
MEFTMRTATFARFVIIAVIALCCLPAVSLADGLNNNEVEFTGKIASVAENGEGGGTLFLSVENFSLKVIVNDNTDLLDNDGDDILMSDLKAAQEVVIRGKYSSDGILASSIRITDNPDTEFELKGHITAIQASGTDFNISLLGIDVTVAQNTAVTSDGVTVAASTLQIGMFVKIRGKQSAGTWTADSVKIISEDRKPEKVRFEGTIVSIDTSNNKMQVAVSGLTAAVTPVYLTTNTRIQGTLAPGAPVLVIGTLNADLSVTASHIRVLRALEIKPDERKLKVGETASFTVKLRQSAAADVTVTLASSDPTTVELSTASLTVPKGSLTADFSATGLIIGSATITAAALGQQATADVDVGDVSEDDNDRPAVRVAFAPHKIKLGPGETRQVVLLVFPPQRTTVAVVFTPANDLVTVTGTSRLGQGTALIKVTVQAGQSEGSSSIVATLPSELGGGKAELLVLVQAKNHTVPDKKPDIDFRPEQVRVFVGDSKTVNLMLSHTPDQAVTVALEVANSGAITGVPSSVVFTAGTRLVQLKVKGVAEGSSTIKATLPADWGSGSSTLSVTVRTKK